VTPKDDPEFDDFYRANYARVVAELILLTRSRADAEDVGQEAFAKAWGKWSEISQYDDPRAWVRRVGYNLAVSRWRSARRLVTLRHRIAEPAGGSGPDGDWVDLARQLAKLPARQRQALLLTAVAGLDSDEVAAQMNVSPATVRSWLHRARNQVLATNLTVTDTPSGEHHAR
jgi:RNA polymerase sigma-70 factor (ECF subfamily)